MSRGICAVVVTYQPDMDVLGKLIEATLPQVDRLIVVDNGSQQDISIQLIDQGVTCLRLGDNLGIATGFNRGITWADTNGFSHVLLLDQDSIPSPEMVEKLLQALDMLTGRGVPVAAVGPRCYDPDTGHSLAFVRFGKLNYKFIYCAEMDDVVPVDFLISSGSLVAVETLHRVGGMDDALFIDLVDVEWFLRASFIGYKAFGVCGATMHHSLGDKTIQIPYRKGNKRYVPVHSSIRYYYIFRNSMLLISKTHMPWQWIVNNSVQLFYSFCFFSLFTAPRLKNIRMIFRGVVDGVKGQTGRFEG